VQRGALWLKIAGAVWLEVSGTLWAKIDTAADKVLATMQKDSNGYLSPLAANKCQHPWLAVPGTFESWELYRQVARLQ
jgi:hypothetical protein